MKKHVLGLVCSGCALWSCADMKKDPNELDSNSLRIGVISNFTGSLASFGRSMYFGIQLAAQQINDAGGVNGQKIQLIPKDDKLEQGAAKQAAQELVDAGVVGIIGSLASSMTIAASEITIPAKVPLISGSSTSPVITSLDDGGTVFRTISSDAFQGEFLANKVSLNSITKASIIYVDNAYGKGLANRFEEVFTGTLHGTVTAKVPYTEGKTKDFGTQVTTLLQGLANGDAVIIFGYETDSAAITSEIAAHSRPELTYWGCDGNYSLAFLKNASVDVVKHMQGSSTQPSTGTNYTNFIDDFKSEVKETPSQYSENVYDALYLMALAMDKAGQNTAQAIIDNLKAVSKNDGADTVIDPGQYAEALQVFKAGGDIDYRGSSGPVDFSSDGDVSSDYLLWKVKSDGSGFETPTP